MLITGSEGAVFSGDQRLGVVLWCLKVLVLGTVEYRSLATEKAKPLNQS